MRLAKVIGNVVATQKEEALIGLKLLVIEEIDAQTEKAKDDRLVAVDTLGAGVGDTVIWVRGGAARVLSKVDRHAPVDAAIVGIVDEVDVV
ncbi:MAG: ethanolamine utilization protein EutN [Chloroflexi bacterium]|nr:MAG: ethanolamine utilization protein EutN [Chloroflexota bacterium]PIE79873.1 MAG: ethanolamine utilization protein EutN [Chloroflexota bacterium]